MDAQSVLVAIEQLLTMNGWVASKCATLSRPFGQNKNEDAYDDLANQGHLYYIGMVIHSADHFLTDQLAVIVQLARRLGTSNLFVSMLDYDSSDSTETLTDLCEGVLTLLGVPYRIRRVPGMTVDPTAAYYPLEEAHTRNLALEPLHELWEKRKIKFHRVIWLKGFTCPNDILETIKISAVNDAAMVCGMDWAEHNGFFIFSDRSVLSYALREKCADVCLDGVHETSMETSSGSRSHHPSLHPLSTTSHHETLLAHNDMPNISHSRSSVVSPEHMSLILHNRTMPVSHTAQGRNSIMPPYPMIPLCGDRMMSVWIVHKRTSVEIYGCGRRRRV